MKRTLFICAFISMVIAAASCDRAGMPHLTGASGDRMITFGDVRIANKDTKGSEASGHIVGTVNDKNISFTVTETVSPLGNLESTKADATVIKTSTLPDFYVRGYYETATKDKIGAQEQGITSDSDLYFIQNATAQKDSPVSGGSTYSWKFTGNPEYWWRYGVNHFFWATYPDLGDSFTITTKNTDSSGASVPEYQTAELNYTMTDANSDTDILVAYTPRYYGKDEEDDDTKKDELNLTFNHALAALNIDESFTYQSRNKAGTAWIDLPSTRNVTVQNFKILNVYKGGTCTFDNSAANFVDWTLSDTDKEDLKLASNGSVHRFIVPQDRVKYKTSTSTDPDDENSILYFEVNDQDRQFICPFVYPASKIFGSNVSGATTQLTGAWEAGHAYKYNFEGNVRVPYQDPGELGIDIMFDKAGNEWRDMALLESFSTKYISEIELAWDGIPHTNGTSTGLWGFIIIQPEGTPQNKTNDQGHDNYTYEYDYYTSSTNPDGLKTDGNGAVFAIYASNGEDIKSGYEGATCRYENGRCYCTINFDTIRAAWASKTPAKELPENIMIIAGYRAPNASPNCGWTTKNTTMKVTKYKWD